VTPKICNEVPDGTIVPTGNREQSRPTNLADLENAIAAIAHTTAANEPTHGGDWLTKPPEYHARHAVVHLEAWLERHDPTDLANALTRAAFATELVCQSARRARQNSEATSLLIDNERHKGG